MERLTMNNGVCQMASTEFCVSQKDCYSCPHGRKCFKRLAAYENTGLELEEYKRQVDALKRLDIEHMHDLLQAEKEGRLIVLPKEKLI